MSKRSHRGLISDSPILTATGVAESVDQPSPDVQVGEPVSMSEEEVAVRAYQRWVARGCPLGTPEEDWYEAERDLLASSPPP